MQIRSFWSWRNRQNYVFVCLLFLYMDSKVIECHFAPLQASLILCRGIFLMPFISSLFITLIKIGSHPAIFTFYILYIYLQFYFQPLLYCDIMLFNFITTLYQFSVLLLAHSCHVWAVCIYDLEAAGLTPARFRFCICSCGIYFFCKFVIMIQEKLLGRF
jgi:hypothetical protein